MPDYYRLNKAKYFAYHGYHPHPGQQAVHYSPARHRVVVAGRRSGKTLLAAREAECVLLQKGKRVWIAAPTHDLTDRVFREIWETFVDNPRTRCSVERKSWTHDHRYLRLRNGSFVEGKTTNSPKSLVGEGLDLLIFDEAAKADPMIWERYLRPTLSDRKGRALFITTPEGRNWIYDLWLRGLGPAGNSASPGSHPWHSFRFPSEANPILDSEEIAQARLELSEDAFAQEYEAAFITFAARVYREFDEAECVRECPVDPAWPLYRSLDIGYRNPFVCLWLQVDPEDRVYVVDEYYATRRTTAENAEAFLEHERRQDYPTPRQSFCDPSAAEARAVMRQMGIRTHAKPTSVTQGIELVRELLGRRADGARGLFVAPHCHKTIREFNLYRYPGDGDYSARERSGTRHAEIPLPCDDHCMDALRYAVMGLEQPAVVRPVEKPRGW